MIAAGSLVGGGDVATADQTVFFDDAVPTIGAERRLSVHSALTGVERERRADRQLQRDKSR